MRYGPNLLEEVLRRTDIVQLVGRRVKLTRKGRVMWGCCPFHKEKSPSFKVENERRTYKCFGCGAGGDAFKWVMETEGLTFPEAVEKLAGEAGVELPKWSPEDEAREEKKKSLYDIVELAAAFYEEQLRGPHGKEARDYLASRGLNDAGAKQFRLGYAPRDNQLIEFLKTKNITLDDMIAAGLARPSDENRGARDFFFDRVMFPISDPRGRMIAFGARALSPDAKPKYINSGENALFSKGHLLYNFATARPAALKNGTIILAEGYMDVIALVRAGFDAAVAPLGTALTEDQLALLWRTAAEPILCFDGDAPGRGAARKAVELALPRLKIGHSLRIAFLPEGSDPDSLIRSLGVAAMQTVISKAASLSSALYSFVTENRDISTPEKTAKLISELDSYVQQIGEPDIRKLYLEDYAERLSDVVKPGVIVYGNKLTVGRQKKGVQPRKHQHGMYATRESPASKSALAIKPIHAAKEQNELEVLSRIYRSPWLLARHLERIGEVRFVVEDYEQAINFLIAEFSEREDATTQQFRNALTSNQSKALVDHLERSSFHKKLNVENATDAELEEAFEIALSRLSSKLTEPLKLRSLTELHHAKKST